MTTAKKKRVISIPHGSPFKVTDTDRDTMGSTSAQLTPYNLIVTHPNNGDSTWRLNYI